MSDSKPAFMKPRSLGSKGRSFMPMTPRNVKSSSESYNDFAKQVTEHTRGEDGQPPHKKFRSSAAPRGSRLAAGYTDRTQQRLQEDDEDDKQRRLKNLETMLKLQQIDQETFDKLRDEIGVGGDTSSTHLVKGLDFKLLERVRRGEDVTKATLEKDKEQPKEPEIDVEDELEKALELDVSVRQHDKGEEKGEQETVTSAAALSRDEILRRLKERRKKPGGSQDGVAADVKPSPSLDQARFKKLDPVKKSNKHKYTESINGRRREVLVITNADGTTKRKTRWLDPEVVAETPRRDETTDQAWGGDLPEEVLAKQKAAAAKMVQQEAEEEAEDIFGGVEDYDPLAEIDSDQEDAAREQAPVKAYMTDKVTETLPTVGRPLQSTAKRNYFTTEKGVDESEKAEEPTHDPAILAALKRAAQIRREEEQADAETTPNVEERDDPGAGDEVRRKALLRKLQQQSGQDDVDIDMSFSGTGRMDDDDDESRQKLSEWKGVGVDEDDEGDDHEKANAKRKRGGKKKKGDKNSFADVMNVIEGRKKA